MSKLPAIAFAALHIRRRAHRRGESDGNPWPDREGIKTPERRAMMLRFTSLIAAVALTPMIATAHENDVSVTRQDDMICIASNGAPNHDMGLFPNRANPNAFALQTLTFCFPDTPQMAGAVTSELMTVGVTLSGLPIRPYTAGYFDANGRGGIGRDPASGWRQQAMHDPRALGMDDQNAHVDQSGLYHYHGVSPDYLASVSDTLIGYAPDGFEIHYAPEQQTSSWRLRDGDRATAPFGPHDGRFEEDFEFVAGSGTLDACNGTTGDGTYLYYATDGYPYFPRCFVGVVNTDFMRRN